MFVSSHVQSTFTLPALLASAPGWSPAYFVGSAAVALRAGLKGWAIGEGGAQVLEGWRVSETPGAVAYDARAATTPVYRQANIDRLCLNLGPQHWQTPQMTGRWCVQPDDVVVNKHAPVRAAFVSTAAKRHAVDGNTLIVRGLTRADAAWVALCLNQPAYQQLLLVESGVLQRVGIGSLESLRLAPTPPQLEGLSAKLRDILDEKTLAGEVLNLARGEAADTVDAVTARASHLAGGAFFPREAVSNESWVPEATALRAEQVALEQDYGWVSVGDLAWSDDRTRLTNAREGARALRLRDVGDDLFVSLAEESPGEEIMTSRTLAKPLVPGEVLLSTLGSSFRVAYVDNGVPPDTFPVDGWARMRFRETPAAWALLLATDPLRSQAARLAVGTVQQFVTPEALRSLRVPVPPRELRDRWQRAVDRHHAQRRALDRQWSVLMNELMTVFTAVHQPFAATTAAEQESRP